MADQAPQPRFLDDRLAHWATVKPDDEAISYLGRSLTWAQFDDRVRRLAGALAERGVGRGDVVGFLDKNHPACVETTLAAACGRHGWPTVADDVLVLTQEAGTWWSHPGPPNRHMWPATLAALAADAELHPVGHPGTDKRHVDFADDAPGWAAFAGRPQPLAAIFALAPFDAAAAEVEIHREPPVRALQTLLRHRYGLIDTPTGLRRAEVEQCSALLGQIPVYAVVRPTRADAYRDVIDRVAQLLPDALP